MQRVPIDGNLWRFPGPLPPTEGDVSIGPKLTGRCPRDWMKYSECEQKVS